MLRNMFVGAFLCALIFSQALAQPAVDRRVLPVTVPNAAASSTLMVATGTGPITVTRASHVIDVTGGATLTVNNIVATAFQAGDTIKVSPASGDTITFGHGEGNITTPSGADIVLNAVTDIAFLNVTASGVVVSTGGGDLASLAPDFATVTLPKVIVGPSEGVSGLTVTYGSSGSPLQGVDPDFGFGLSSTAGYFDVETMNANALIVSSSLASQLRAGTGGIATALYAESKAEGTWGPGASPEAGVVPIFTTGLSSRSGVVFGAGFHANCITTTGCVMRGIEVDTISEVDNASKIGIEIVSPNTDVGDTTDVVAIDGNSEEYPDSFGIRIGSVGSGVGFFNGIGMIQVDGGANPLDTSGNAILIGGVTAGYGINMKASAFSQAAIAIPNNSFLDAETSGGTDVPLIGMTSGDIVNIASGTILMDTATAFLDFFGGAGANTPADNNFFNFQFNNNSLAYFQYKGSDGTTRNFRLDLQTGESRSKAARAHKNGSAQGFADGVYEKAEYVTTAYNLDNTYDNTNFRWTPGKICPVIVDIGQIFNSNIESTDTVDVAIYKNGSSFYRKVVHSTRDGELPVNITLTSYADAVTDYFEIWYKFTLTENTGAERGINSAADNSAVQYMCGEV